MWDPDFTYTYIWTCGIFCCFCKAEKKSVLGNNDSSDKNIYGIIKSTSHISGWDIYKPQQCSAEKYKTYPVPTRAGILNFMPRDQWQAEPPRGVLTMNKGKPKLDYVIVSHTADIGVFDTTEQCAKGVKTAQEVAFQRGFDDIAYNYLIGNDGVVYIGRDWMYKPAIAKGWNDGIGIAFIGIYVDGMPSKAAVLACKAFLEYLVNEKILKPDFALYALRQVRPMFSVAPGDELYNDMKTWKGVSGNAWAWRELNVSKETNATRS